MTKGDTHPNETKKPLTSENSLLKVKSDLQKYKTGARGAEASETIHTTGSKLPTWSSHSSFSLFCTEPNLFLKNPRESLSSLNFSSFSS